MFSNLLIPFSGGPQPVTTAQRAPALGGKPSLPTLTEGRKGGAGKFEKVLMVGQVCGRVMKAEDRHY